MLTIRNALIVAAVLVLALGGAALAGSGEAADTTTTTVSQQTTTTLPPTTTTALSDDGPGIVTVPDLSGLTLAEARALLGDAGLDVVALPEPIDEAIVVAQEPAPGTEIAAGGEVVVDVQRIATCNAPDPLAPGPGQAIITVLYECDPDANVLTAGTGVPRIVPEPQTAEERLEWTLRSLLAGPTADEQKVGFVSGFDASTADALNSVTLTDGRLRVDFNDAIIVNNMGTATGMIQFNAELKRNVFPSPEVDTVEFSLNGDCEAWSALFESDGCWVISRADWNQELAG
jgi:hypothetical protein